MMTDEVENKNACFVLFSKFLKVCRVSLYPQILSNSYIIGGHLTHPELQRRVIGCMLATVAIGSQGVHQRTPPPPVPQSSVHYGIEPSPSGPPCFGCFGVLVA